MPAKRYARRSNTRRSYKSRRYPSRRKRSNYKAKITRALAPWQHLVKHRWSAQEGFTVPAITTVDKLFRANSIFEPDPLIATHPAMGFDQWRAIYDEYTVIGSKITVKIFAIDVEEICTWALTTLSESTAVTNMSENIEQNGTRTTMVGMEQGGKPFSVLTSRYSAKKWTKSKVMSNEELDCVGNNLPAEQFYYHLIAQNGHTEGANFQIQMLIEYTVIWREPVRMAPSVP